MSYYIGFGFQLNSTLRCINIADSYKWYVIFAVHGMPRALRIRALARSVAFSNTHALAHSE